MKKLLFAITLLYAGLTSAQLNINTTDAKVEFDYISEKTKGTLSDVTATVKINPSDLSKSEVSGKAPVKTLDTKNGMRNKHLMSKEYFNVEQYAYMTFKSTSITLVEGVYKAKGKLKIKDIEKDVTFTLKEEEGDHISLTAYIYAEDFGIAIKQGRDKSKVKVKVIL